MAQITVNMNESTADSAVPRPRVLLVEDQALVAMEFGAMLEELGCTVVGPCATVASALELIRTQPLDGAVLDVTLVNEESFPIAARLQTLRVPFFFVTGISSSTFPAAFRQSASLAKPVQVHAFAAQVNAFRTAMAAGLPACTAERSRS